MMTYQSGDKPGVGTYTCTNCGTKVILPDNNTALPICPKCGNNHFKK